MLVIVEVSTNNKKSLTHRLWSEVLTALVVNNTVFWYITPCSRLKISRSFGGICRLHLQGRRINRARNQPCFPPAFTLVSCSFHIYTLKMKATCSTETLADFQRTTRRYTTDDSTLHLHAIRFCLPRLFILFYYLHLSHRFLFIFTRKCVSACQPPIVVYSS
jgi:hypothetical protein